MPLTQTEKNRRYREKQRQERSAQKRQPIGSEVLFDFRTPFFRWLEEDGNWSEVALSFAAVGLEPPRFDDDRGAFSSKVDEFENAHWDPMPNPYEVASNSLGRATMMVGVLLDATASFAGLVNRYLISELEQRIAELDASDHGEDDVKRIARAALQQQISELQKPEILRLKKWKP
jgi:hypothetical protein